MRHKIVVANWKMHTTIADGVAMLHNLLDSLHDMHVQAEVVIAPPFTHLDHFAQKIHLHPFVVLGAQNCHFKNAGSFTGEVSPETLSHIGVSYVIVGHSERRQYFNETDDVIYQKLVGAIENDMTPILCCGETSQAREEGNHFKMVKEQLENSLFKLPTDWISKVAIAYEPVWAIGTGKTATPTQAQEMHSSIRKLVADKIGNETGVSILYGGSCNDKNAKELFAQPDIDGGLIGGASLNSASFLKIIQSLP